VLFQLNEVGDVNPTDWADTFPLLLEKFSTAFAHTDMPTRHDHSVLGHRHTDDAVIFQVLWGVHSFLLIQPENLSLLKAGSPNFYFLHVNSGFPGVAVWLCVDKRSLLLNFTLMILVRTNFDNDRIHRLLIVMGKHLRVYSCRVKHEQIVRKLLIQA
jgi:hypothetical protein